MRILGVIIFLTGMFMFASGLVFLDLASLVLKADLYTIDILARLNNLFSLDPSLATMQTVLSGLFVLMGCFICFSGAVMMRVKKVETEEESIDRALREGGYPPYNDKNLRHFIPNYERVVSGKPFGNFIAFPTQMARATYNKMVKLGIVNGKVWKS